MTVNDYDVNSVAEITANIELNHMMVLGGMAVAADNGINVSCFDANVILHQRQFHFMYVEFHEVFFDYTHAKILPGDR